MCWVHLDLSWLGPRSTHDNFGVPSHRLNFATSEQKGITQTIILTPSRSFCCLPYQCISQSWEAQPTSSVWRGWGSHRGRLPASRADTLTTRLQRRSIMMSHTAKETRTLSAIIWLWQIRMGHIFISNNRKSYGDSRHSVRFDFEWPWEVKLKVNVICHISESIAVRPYAAVWYEIMYGLDLPLAS